MSDARTLALVVSTGIALVVATAVGGWAVWMVLEWSGVLPWAGHLPDRPLAVPLAALLMGTALGFTALVLARHRDRILWLGTDRGAEGRAALHREVTSFVALLAMLGAAALAAASLARLDAAAGADTGAADAFRRLGAGFFVVALGGAVLLMVRHGFRRGTARGPGTDPDAPPRLADPSRWRLGLFYVAPGEPAVFVEKRVGVGFTLNLGNPRVLACLALLVAAAGAIPLLCR